MSEAGPGAQPFWRADHQAIFDLVPAGVRLLDIGCGAGELLSRLRAAKNVATHGLELSQAGVSACLAAGLSVIQGDAERDLSLYPDDSFDWVVLSKTIQAMRRPGALLRDIRRLAPRVILSIPNFGHWRVRLSLVTQGRMPRTAALPAAWHETDNIHLCTVLDMHELAATCGFGVEHIQGLSRGRIDVGSKGGTGRLRAMNWHAEEAIFVLARADIALA